VTLKARKGIASLRRPDVVREVEDAFRRGRARASRERLRLAHYSIQGNHLRTWLLRKGWRRRGLLDPGDVPGTV